jgi:hypothetical protein
VLACNRTPEPVGSASLTSAEQAIAPPPTGKAGEGAENSNDSLVCEGPTSDRCEGLPAASLAPAPVEPLAHAARRFPHRKAHATLATGKDVAPTSEATGDKSALDEAIQQEASLAPDHEHAAGRPVDDTATITAAAIDAKPQPAQVPSRISFQSQLPGAYRLQRVQLLVDGVPEYDASSPGSVTVPSGEHLVQVIADYQLRDSLFGDVDGYRIEMKSGEVLRPGTDLLATAHRIGGVTTPVPKSVQVDWRTVPAR